MKGIILAGGLGSRLRPITYGVSKHLLPVYDKPMIYYPLSVLMLAGIRDILIITTPDDLPNYKRLMGNGGQLGVRIAYETQQVPDGIPSAFLIGEEFIGTDSVCLILGDNIFYGQDFTAKIKNAAKTTDGATLFCCRVGDPARFGVISFDETGKPLMITEKPKVPASDFAVTGLYFYNNEVVAMAKDLKPSARGELEITDLNNNFIKRGSVKLELLGRGFTWMDAGTHDSLIAAGSVIQSIEKNQNMKIANVDEIAYKQGWIDRDTLQSTVEDAPNTDYTRHLIRILDT
ncbi:glucose-1-phosphate thymidylyltransferase RfbA [bacterium]|nr:glucose-1-phosphate thymidylyltransferase RfbA [bacterium]